MLVILLRMGELSSGRVLIDGIDISKIGLHDLRSRMAIIPQDPTIFSGTIRTNLDPFNEYSNDEIWEVLRLSQLKDVVETDGGLEAVVQEDGLNYSLGQRQLLCMARAILRRPKM
jgi:ATP-binding cassette subfamily C (CFTR/MRP) protein 2